MPTNWVLRAAVPGLIVATLACLAMRTFAAASQVAKPTDPAGWSALAAADVEAMHALLLAHTPIPFDKENPAYSLWLEEGHDAAIARAAEVTNEAGYVYTVVTYANGFRDPHINLQIPRPPAIRWPGFMAIAYGDELVVTQRDSSDALAPAIGTRIASCDGQKSVDLVRSRQTPFVRGYGMPERWSIPDLFLDKQNPFVPLLTTCSLREGDGVVEISLRWRRISGVLKTFGTDLNNAVIGPATEWGLTEPVPGVFWIGIPTFLHLEREQLRKLVEAVKAREKELRNARAIVIDTRGNSGGTTIWATKLAEAIFTPKVLKAATRNDRKRRTAVDLRSSPANISYLSGFIDGLQGSDVKDSRRTFEYRLNRLERAAKQNPPVARIGSKKPSPAGGLTTQRPADAESPFPARVYFLSNGSCNSACLYFADKVLSVPGVRLIGSATSSDTSYGEVRGEPLPSGLAVLTLPQSLSLGRGRGALEAYEPDVVYTGSWEDAYVRAWTFAVIDFEAHQ